MQETLEFIRRFMKNSPVLTAAQKTFFASLGDEQQFQIAQQIAAKSSKKTRLYKDGHHNVYDMNGIEISHKEMMDFMDSQGFLK